MFHSNEHEKVLMHKESAQLATPPFGSLREGGGSAPAPRTERFGGGFNPRRSSSVEGGPP